MKKETKEKLSLLVDEINAGRPRVGNGCEVAFEAYTNHRDAMASVYIENLATSGAFIMEFFPSCKPDVALKVAIASARAAWPNGGIPE